MILPQITNRDRVKWGSVSALSAGAYTVTLHVMVKIVKGGGRATPTPHQSGLIFPSRWNVRLKAVVATLCLLCGTAY